MNMTVDLAGAALTLLPSGALWWPDAALLAVADLHLGKSERVARLGGALLPPYETIHTLDRLEGVVTELSPKTLVLLGDSFDDMEAAGFVAEDVLVRLHRLAAGRQLIWIAGNHDPGPVELPGTHRADYHVDVLTFRHIADHREKAEISGHYHPKARLRVKGSHISRACFLGDRDRLILPAFGTYTGGLDIRTPVLAGLMGPGARAYLTGRRVTALPLPLPA